MRSRGTSRSQFVEVALWAYIAHLEREERDARNLEILNRNADRLNQEALDVLSYQVIPSTTQQSGKHPREDQHEESRHQR